MKVAIIHDWLVTLGGAEKVLAELIALYPQADVFSVVDFLDDRQRASLHGRRAQTSFIQRLPGARRFYRHYLPLMPLAIEQFDLSSYDLVISSSHAVAKGVITGPRQLHVCYCHSPMRYAWDLQSQYLHESGLEHGVRGWLVRYLLHRIRAWDYRTANGVDCFVANSGYIAQRIWKVYRREATVIYPCVATDDFELSEERDSFYVTASRMVPYKKMDLIVQAFAQMPDKRLVVIGDGPQMGKIQAAVASNVQILGYQPFPVLKDYLQRAQAFVFAAEEDFGILPVEAQACGTPVIAFGAGGALETVIDGQTGVLYPAQTTAALCDAVVRFESGFVADRARIRAHAETFNAAYFREHFRSLVDDRLTQHNA
ncbi:glycosyltransferase family 4 protein [Corticimicrobacter populi]|uniref:Glycosyl transferase family 1 n=1 Tax=Corticimicrobacter populi TaxID=2175229 RepID=A0A2V1JZM4_9BURK|nr:glycosyltransferase family 4 protein [Corticimicrobacter populi]PWF22183.1 glycosyl transferase family 1 [Corticimicrobacter populi]